VTLAVAQLVAVVYGLHQHVLDVYILNYGQQAVMEVVLVHVTGVITIKAHRAALITKNQLSQHQVVHIECVQVEFIDV
jgi:hypothetical protein